MALQGRMKTYSPVAFVEQPTEKTEYNGHLKCLKKQPQEKEIGELWATMHAHMDCLIMYQ